MPIHQRKFIIMKHNMEQEGVTAERKRKELGDNSSVVNGIAINEFAKMEQKKQEAFKQQ